MLSIEIIKYSLSKPLPGIKIQKQLLPGNRATMPSKKTAIKNGAVLILLFNKNNHIYFLLTKRTINLRFHSGQIALPGGKFDTADKSLLQTALRETFEETGCRVSKNQVIAKLTPLYIPVSKFWVYPFVAYIPKYPVWQKNNTEVNLLIEVNLKDFLSVKPLHKTTMEDNKLIKIPYFLINGYEVWGATAMILNELKFMLQR